jgi:D-alanine-D-alanine ligase-like ATP-grasp enzyme
MNSTLATNNNDHHVLCGRQPMKVAVVMGGAGPEHRVSLGSGKGIVKAVELLGHAAIPMVIDADGNWVDGQHEAIEILQACEVTIPALHGEGGALQGFLTQLKIPYVGSGVAASAVGQEKHLTRAVLSAHGIPVTSQDMVGREIGVAVLECPGGRVRTAPTLKIHSELAVDVFEVLGCRGLARVDFVVPADGDPAVDGINTSPGLTPGAQFPRMWASAGLSYADIVDILIRTAMS